MACGLGGSGSFSMLEKRNASGQLVNDSTRDGERLVGTGYGMAPMVGRGCREVAGPRPRPARPDQRRGRTSSAKATTSRATASGSCMGPKWVSPGNTCSRPSASAAAIGRGDHPGRVLVRRPGHHEDRAGHLAQVGEGVLAGAALEDAGLLLGLAGQLDRAVGPVEEAVVDVGPQRLGRQRVERRLAGVVVVGLLPAGEHGAPAAGPGHHHRRSVRPGRGRGGRRWARRRPARRTCGAAPARP